MDLRRTGMLALSLAPCARPGSTALWPPDATQDEGQARFEDAGHGA